MQHGPSIQKAKLKLGNNVSTESYDCLLKYVEILFHHGNSKQEVLNENEL